MEQFELVCLLHVEQIKRTLGIAVIASDVCSWNSESSDPGAQIDLLIDLCEAKWSGTPYSITKSYDANLRNKLHAFATEAKTGKALHLVLVTPRGLKRNVYANNVQAEISTDDLFGE